MFQYTAFAVVCLVQIVSASDYGVQNNDYSPPKSYGGYGQGGYGPGDYDYGYDHDNKGSCRHLRQLHLNGQQTHRASISEYERKGKTYIKISCRNHNQPFALVAEKDGSNTQFETVNIPNTVLLTAGFNVDFVAECRHGRRIVGRGVNGDRHSIKKVTCVRLSEPSDITTL